MNSSTSSSNERSSPIRPLLAGFVATLSLLLLATAAYVWSKRAYFPAPRISDNFSFNEKLAWLRDVHAAGRHPELILIGSSMALSNLSAGALSDQLKLAPAINLASWGITPKEDERLFQAYVAADSSLPKMVVLSVYHGDFIDSAAMRIDWSDVESVLTGHRSWPLYFKHFDPDYYWKSLRDSVNAAPDGNRSYMWLGFDATGSVSLSSDHFHILPGRWDWYKEDAFLTKSIDPESIASVGHIARWCAEHHVRFVVCVCPLRQAADAALPQAPRLRIWTQLEAAIAPSGGRLIRCPSGPDWPDSLYTDFAHFNEAGTRQFTAYVAQQLSH